MNKKIVIPFALAILSAALFGCSSNKVKEEKIKPNPLPKLQQSIGLAPVFSQSVSSTSSQDPLRLQLAIDQGVYFLPDPKGVVSAYKGKQRLWEKRVSKQGITSGAEAAAGVVVVGNSKGEVFALDQATGEQKWKAQASGALLSPALIYNGRAILVANDSTVFAFDVENGQVAWTYKLPHTPLSLRAQAAPVPVDARTVAIGTSNGYVYAIDSLTGVPRMQQRVAVSEGRSDVQRLVDIAADPVVVGQFMVTTSFQGQVTVTDLTTQRVIWSQDASSVASPAVHEGKVFVSTIDGKVLASICSVVKKFGIMISCSIAN